MYCNLVKVLTCDALATEYYAATKSVKNSGFAFVEIVITEVVHRRALGEALDQGFDRWLRSDTLM